MLAHLHRRAVETADQCRRRRDAQLLQPLEDTLPDAFLRPPIPARADRVPIAVAFRQTAPRATFLQHVETRVDHGPVVELDVAARCGRQMFNGVELLVRELHGDFLSLVSILANISYVIVLTQPSSRCETLHVKSKFDYVTVVHYVISTF